MIFPQQGPTSSLSAGDEFNEPNTNGISPRCNEAFSVEDEMMLAHDLGRVLTIEELDRTHLNQQRKEDQPQSCSSSSSSTNFDRWKQHSQRRSTTNESQPSSQRRSSSGRKTEHQQLLRDKFEIESLYKQLSELRRENEALRELWEDVRRTTTTQNGSAGAIQTSAMIMSPIPLCGGK